MKKRQANLLARRCALLQRIEAQRAEIAELSRHWQKPLALADVGLKAVNFLRDRPGWVAAAMAVLVAYRRKGFLVLAQQGWHMWCRHRGSRKLP